MQNRLNNSHYVVFGLVLLVLVMGIVGSVYGIPPQEGKQDDGPSKEEIAESASGGYGNQQASVPNQQVPNARNQQANNVGHDLSQVRGPDGRSVDQNNNEIIDIADRALNADESYIAGRIGSSGGQYVRFDNSLWNQNKVRLDASAETVKVVVDEADVANNLYMGSCVLRFTSACNNVYSQHLGNIEIASPNGNSIPGELVNGAKLMICCKLR